MDKEDMNKLLDNVSLMADNKKRDAMEFERISNELVSGINLVYSLSTLSLPDDLLNAVKSHAVMTLFPGGLDVTVKLKAGSRVEDINAPFGVNVHVLELLPGEVEK